ncbi:hypothetical protein TUMEXPCC7403_19485 [Tumidithrix helvetica PCC 7403]|uniref:hypothetical protein n=1 Tax=Tumidithrix helvetica TaxID=3457545 RepID=UPI003C8DB260
MVMQSIQIEIEVDLKEHYTVSTLHQAIQEELQKYGKPLNWLVLDADKERQKVRVKAMILAHGSNASV